MNFDFGELKNDTNFTSKVQGAAEAVAKIEKHIKDSSEVKLEELSTEERVKHDLFLIYAVNSLYWMYLKMNGDNPSSVSLIQFSVNLRKSGSEIFSTESNTNSAELRKQWNVKSKSMITKRFVQCLSKT